MPRPRASRIILPAYAGLAMQEELEALEKALGHPQHPVVAIVGGAKISSKLELLANLIRKVDALVIGGGMANTFLAAKGVEIGKSLNEPDLQKTAKQIMLEAAERGCAIVLPTDVVVADAFEANAPHKTVAADKVPADMMILDVGEKIGRGDQRLDRQGEDAGLERTARRVREGAVRPRHGRRGEACREAHARGKASLGRRRRRYGRGAEPCRRGGRFQLRLDRRRRVSGMAGGQAAAGRRSASRSAGQTDQH